MFGNVAPKELHIKKEVFEVNLDSYMEMQKQAAKELSAEAGEGDVVEGEVVDSD